MYLLADQQYVYSAEIEIVVEWERSKTIVGRVVSSIELQTTGKGQLHDAYVCERGSSYLPHHDRLALVLDDMTRTPDLVTASQAQEHQLVRRIHRLIRARRVHCRRFSFGSHVYREAETAFCRDAQEY